MTQRARIDYGLLGVSIQEAQLREARAFATNDRKPRSILWNGREVWTTYEIAVLPVGRFTLEFMSAPTEPLRGVDVSVEGGGVLLDNDELVPVLRTWNDRRFEEKVGYRFRAPDGVIRIWNVFQRRWPDGRITNDKWSGNAGFVVVPVSASDWVLHCSSDLGSVPDFDDLVLRFSIRPLDGDVPSSGRSV